MLLVFLCSMFLANHTYGREIDGCYTAAAIKYGVPEVVLRSISAVESGNNRYAVNINGSAVYSETEEHAVQVIRNNRNKSIDIGLMQINKVWFKKFGYPLELGLNACWSIHMGAYILQYEYIRHNGDIWKAIAHYHSPTKKYQNRYMNKVYKEIKKWQSIN